MNPAILGGHKVILGAMALLLSAGPLNFPGLDKSMEVVQMLEIVDSNAIFSRDTEGKDVTEKEIRNALDRAGYVNIEPTIDNLLDCFMDYAEAGYWDNLNHEDIDEAIKNGDITLKDIIKNLR